MTTIAERVKWLQQQLEDLAEAADEQAESQYHKGAEDGYQDGLNDALGFVKDYLNGLDRDEYDGHYLDALEDALITLRHSGAEDTIVTPTGAVVVAEPQSTPVADPSAATDVDEHVDSP